jgi:SAM-dependent methyltransferase
MILIYLTILLLICYVLLHSNKIEGFIGKEETPLLSGVKNYYDENVYDAFYCYVYDDIMKTIPYLEEMVLLIKDLFSFNNNILCLGSKTGHIVELLSEGNSVVGLENSLSMIKMSKYKYPKNNYVYGNYLDNSLFSNNQFTHVLIPMLTIHTIPDLYILFQNLDKWVVHKGHIAIMYFDLSNFDPTILLNKNPSRYFNFNYNYKIEYKDGKLIDFISDSYSNKRTNVLKLNKIDRDELLNNARNNGFHFRYHKKMKTINSNLLILQKSS